MSQCISCVAQDNPSSSSVAWRRQKLGHPCMFTEIYIYFCVFLSFFFYQIILLLFYYSCSNLHRYFIEFYFQFILPTFQMKKNLGKVNFAKLTQLVVGRAETKAQVCLASTLTVSLLD